MRYANPNFQEEFEYVIKLRREIDQGLPSDLGLKMRRFYGEPVREDVPLDLVSRLQAIPVNCVRRSDYNVDTFQAARKVLLQVFYPTNEGGFRSVREYWKRLQ